MSRWKASGTSRACAAGPQVRRAWVAGVVIALFFVAMALSGPIVRLIGWGGMIGDAAPRQDVPSSALHDAFGFEGAAEDLPIALFSYLSGSDPVQPGLPEAFEEEVLCADRLDSLEVASNGSTVGIVSRWGPCQIRDSLLGSLEAGGWVPLTQDGEPEDGTRDPWSAVFAKDDGSLRWLHVALYPMEATTTCVFQAQGVDRP